MALESPQLVKLTIKPGVNRETTRYGAEGTWYDTDKVRFRYGMPEKIGGWQNVNGSGDTLTFQGLARALLNWPSNDGTLYTAIGTESHLYLWSGGSYYDITPVVASVVGASANYTTSAGSNQIKVSLASHGFLADDYGIFRTSPSAIGPVSIWGSKNITSVVDTNSFFVSIISATSASTVPVSLNYDRLLSPGRRDSATGFGWGASGWGHSGGWGAAAPVGTQITLRLWSLDNWGEDLVANPKGQAIYHWIENSGTTLRAFRVSGAPDVNDHILVSPEDRHLIALGTQDILTSVYDPTLIRWCSRENINDWSPSATNTAGDKRISGARKIVGKLRSRGQILIWSEDTLYSMRHVGQPLVFAFDTIGEDAGLVGQNAIVEANGRTYWMSNQRFMQYDGAAPRPLNCTVLRYIFDNIDTTQYDKVYAGVNSAFNEVIWLYQDLSSTGDVNRYVTYNYLEDSWAIGSFERTAWTSDNIYGAPLGAGIDSKLYYHDVGSDADSSAITAYVESADFDLGDGQQVIFADRIIPDFSARDGSALSGNVQLTLTGRLYPGSSETITKGPYTVSAATKFVEYRLRARQMSFKVATSGTDESWRMGAPRVRLAGDGER